MRTSVPWGGGPRRRASGRLLLLLWLAPGCMATAGLVAGPVAGPISSIQHDGSCTEAWFSIPFGMYMGFCRGLEKDLDFLTHASYFAPGTMRMALVFDAFAGIKGGPETLYQPAGPANGAADPKARIPTQDVERSAR